MVLNIPIVGVDHVEAHVYSGLMHADESILKDAGPPSGSSSAADTPPSTMHRLHTSRIAQQSTTPSERHTTKSQQCSGSNTPEAQT